MSRPVAQGFVGGDHREVGRRPSVQETQNQSVGGLRSAEENPEPGLARARVAARRTVENDRGGRAPLPAERQDEACTLVPTRHRAVRKTERVREVVPVDKIGHQEPARRCYYPQRFLKSARAVPAHREEHEAP